MPVGGADADATAPPGGCATDWEDISRRKKLADRVAGLSGTEHEQILRILHSNGLRYTRNNNGVFCDITRAPVAVLDMVDRFIDYSMRSAQVLEEERCAAVKAAPAKAAAVGRRDRPPGAAHRAERVRAFTNSMSRTKTETTAQKRKEACRYQQLRKKYLREVGCKTHFSNELRPE